LELVVPLIIEMDRERRMVDWRANAPDCLAVILQAHPNKRTHCDPYFPSLLRQRRRRRRRMLQNSFYLAPPRSAWSLSVGFAVSRDLDPFCCNIASYSGHMHGHNS
jgi:hypothetical protein